MIVDFASRMKRMLTVLLFAGKFQIGFEFEFGGKE